MQLLERGSFLRTLRGYATEARGGDGRLVWRLVRPGLARPCSWTRFTVKSQRHAGCGARATGCSRRGECG
jgi:hypothetical protein